MIYFVSSFASYSKSCVKRFIKTCPNPELITWDEIACQGVVEAVMCSHPEKNFQVVIIGFPILPKWYVEDLKSIGGSVCRISISKMYEVGRKTGEIIK